MKEFHKIDILEELNRRGIQYNISGHNAMINCVYHSDSSPSMGIAIEGDRKGLFRCLSQNCGKTGTFFDLISHFDGTDLSEVKSKYKIDFDIELDVKSLPRFFINQLKKRKSKSTIKIISKKKLKKFCWIHNEYLDYLKGLTRKLTDKTIKKWKIICCIKGKWKGRVIIPVYDEKNRLISFVARSIDPNADKKSKVRKLKNTDIRKVVFGLNHIKDTSFLYIVEGEFDAVYLQQYKIPAVCIGGLNNISSTHIRKMGNVTDHVIIALDGDVNKFKIRELRKKINGYFKTSIIYLPKNKDPNDLSEKQIKKIFIKEGEKYENKKN